MRKIERLFNSVLEETQKSSNNRGFPKLHVRAYSTEKIEFLFFIPGYRRYYLKVWYVDEFLKVSGKYPKNADPDRTTPTGEFLKEIWLPSSIFDKEETKVEYEDGVLTILVEKKKKEDVFEVHKELEYKIGGNSEVVF